MGMETDITVRTHSYILVYGYTNLQEHQQVVPFLKRRDYLETKTKTHCILFQTKLSRQESELKIPGKNREIVNAKSTNYLGVIIDNNLNWEVHIERTYSRISR
jgi:hypothetical protein